MSSYRRTWWLQPALFAAVLPPSDAILEGSTAGLSTSSANLGANFVLDGSTAGTASGSAAITTYIPGPESWSGAVFSFESRDAVGTTNPTMVDKVNSSLTWTTTSALDTTTYAGKQVLGVSGITKPNGKLGDAGGVTPGKTLYERTSLSLCLRGRINSWTAQSSGTACSVIQLGPSSGGFIPSREMRIDVGTSGSTQWITKIDEWTPASALNVVTAWSMGNSPGSGNLTTVMVSYVYVISASSLTIYRNGVSVASGVNVAAAMTNISAGSTTMGINFNKTSPLFTHVSMGAGFNRALTATEASDWHTYASGYV